MKKIRFKECVSFLTGPAYMPYTLMRPYEYSIPDAEADGYIQRGIAWEVAPEIESASLDVKPTKRKYVKKSNNSKQ